MIKNISVGLGGGMIFEAEVYTKKQIKKSGQGNPFITFYNDSEGHICLNFRNFDAKEMIDGYSIEQIDELIHTIKEAKKYAEEINKPQYLLFEDGATLNSTIDKEEIKTMVNRNNETFVMKLIELSSECIDSYERYLLDEVDHRILAKKMKQLRTHITKFTEMYKDDLEKDSKE